MIGGSVGRAAFRQVKDLFHSEGLARPPPMLVPRFATQAERAWPPCAAGWSHSVPCAQQHCRSSPQGATWGEQAEISRADLRVGQVLPVGIPIAIEHEHRRRLRSAAAENSVFDLNFTSDEDEDEDEQGRPHR